MNYKRIYKIYFSPTGTTETVVNTLSESLKSNLREFSELSEETFDFTTKSARSTFPALNEDDLVVFGCPTYAGRLPNLLLPYLDTVEGGGASAVAVATFGNRSFDNSLSELSHILNTHNFKVVAAAGLSCEHSFSYTLGKGRPDADDMTEIIDFAGKVAGKLSLPEEKLFKDFHIEGKSFEENFGGYYQPRDRHGNSIDIRKVKPLTDESKCSDCRFCYSICPMGAIDSEDPVKVPGICIKCGACIKKCPAQAKYYDDPGYLYHKRELEEMYSRRAENSFFL